jgi:DNA-binding SARP family transcriptional activator
MFSGGRPQISFTELFAAAQNPILFLAPWADASSSTLIAFEEAAAGRVIYHHPVPSQRSLRSLVMDIVAQFERVFPGTGDGIRALPSGASPADLGQALAVNLSRQAQPFVLVIDDFEPRTLGEEMVQFLGALGRGILPGGRLLLSAHQLYYADWGDLLANGSAAVISATHMRGRLTFSLQAKPAPQLEVRAFGRGTAFLNGREISHWEGALPRSMFFYLVSHPLISRDDIFLDFWPQPQVSLKDATDIFHVTKHKVSEVLGRHLGTSRMLELTRYKQGFYIPSSRISRYYDVADFTATLQLLTSNPSGEWAERLLRRAVDLYKGPFLVGTENAWVQRIRTRLAREYSDALIKLGMMVSARGDDGEALNLLEHAVMLRPEREDVRRAYISTLAARGDMDEAREQYQRMLREIYLPLSIAITPETRALASQIGA